MDIEMKPQNYLYWLTRTLDDPKRDWNTNDKDWIEGYEKSIVHPHRQLILNELRKIQFDSLIEIGCNVGANLKIISSEFPESKLMGIDINAESIKRARIMSPEINFKIGEASSLGNLKDKSFDVLLTDAVLMYINPEEIFRTIKGFDRIVRKAMIFIEWHDENSVLGRIKDFHWTRNYKKLMEEFGYKVEMKEIKESDWPTPKWYTNGRIFISHKV